MKKYGVIFLLVLFFIGCQDKDKAKGKKEEPMVIPVKAGRVILKDMSKILDYVGNIKAREGVLIYPKVSGKILEIVKEESDEVHKNEAIIFIDRDETGLKFEKAPVESPISGVVGRVYVDRGNAVGPQTAVALIVSLDQVEVELNIPEDYLPKISLGQFAKVLVGAYSDKSFEGVVSRISPVVDIQTRTAPIRITIENRGYFLKSGMLARVSLRLEEHKNIPVILKEALVGRAPEAYVYLVEKDKAILRKVDLGVGQGEFLEIKEGLKEGDLVVVMGKERLRDGVAVTTEIIE